MDIEASKLKSLPSVDCNIYHFPCYRFARYCKRYENGVVDLAVIIRPTRPGKMPTGKRTRKKCSVVIIS